MLAVTKNTLAVRYDAPSHGAIQISVLNLVTASISPSVLAVRELHALSPPSAGRYALVSTKMPLSSDHFLSKWLLLGVWGAYKVRAVISWIPLKELTFLAHLL